MIVKLTTFNKRENSTNIYSGEWLQFNCVLKDDCSVISPRIEIQTTTDLSPINYARIDAFHRYYFVDDISYERDTIVLLLRCDVMATYKSYIGASSEYILRSASDYNGDIIDTLYPTKTDCTYSLGSAHDFLSRDNITYVVGIMNNMQSNKMGVTQYYVMTPDEIADLVKFLFGGNPNDYIDNMETFITGMSEEFQNAIIRSLSNPSQFIVDSFALPYRPNCGASETITIGYLPSYITGCPITDVAFNTDLGTYTFELPSHPQAATRGHYLSAAPYTRYWLDLGPLGIYPIDATCAINYPSVEVTIAGDMFGNIRAMIAYAPHIIDYITCNVRCNFPIAQVSFDVVGAAQNAIGMLTSQTSANAGDSGEISNAIISGVGGVATGILSSLKTLQPQVSRSGTQGTITNCFFKITSRACFFTLADEDNTHRGRPLCEQRTINTLSGYILVADADLSIPGTKEENKQIKNYMNTGFYYE